MSNYVFVDDHSSTMRQRCQMACVFCRRRKIKCDGRTSCVNCLRHSEECKYEPIKKDIESGPNSNKSQSLTSTPPSNSIATPKRRRLQPREQQIEAQGAVYHNEEDITADVRSPISEQTEYPITGTESLFIEINVTQCNSIF